MKSALELERLLLGALLDLEDPKRALDASGLNPEDFTDSAMRTAFDFTRRRAERHLVVSAVDVWSTATKAGKLQADDLTWLNTLEAGNALDERAFLRLAEDLRGQVRSRRLAARLRELAQEVDRQAMPERQICSTLDGLSMQLARTYQANRTAENDPAEIIEEWDRRVREGRPLFTPTGVPLFDREFGGYVPNFNLVAGPPSIGKSALVASGIRAQLELPKPMRIGLFGLEDGHKWLTRRYMAHRLGIRVRDVGNLAMDAAGWSRAADVGAELSPLLRNLLVYKWGGASAEEICRWALGWIINEGVECIYIDNASELDHRAPQRPGNREFDFRIQVARSIERLRDFAVQYQIPVVMLAHTTRDYEEDRHKRPPAPSDTAEGAAFERKTRLFLGCWAKQWSTELRITLGKMNEGESGQTFGFERHKESALLDLESGRLIDLKHELRKERDEKKGQALEQQVADGLLKAAMREKAKAAMKGAATPPTPAPVAEAPKPAPQVDLFSVKRCEACQGTELLGMGPAPCPTCQTKPLKEPQP